MINVNYVLNQKKELKKINDLIKICESFNKQNNKDYFRFSNKQTNNNGCLDLIKLYNNKITKQQHINNVVAKFKNYYKCNFKNELKINEVFQK